MKEAKQWGFVRETQKMADSAKIKNPRMNFTAMDDYLSVIYPGIHDWVHDKSIPGFTDAAGNTIRTRPDFRSESLKLIIEFDGLQHYTNPDNIATDEHNTEVYERAGYKVVRIPYFVQLTNEAVRQMFGIEVQEPLFNPAVNSISNEWKNSPAYLCPAGIRRMAKEYRMYPQQYQVNIEYLKNEDSAIDSACELLEKMP